MKTRSKQRDHSGLSFDSFLEQEGIREEAEAVAIKRVLAWQLKKAIRKQQGEAGIDDAQPGEVTRASS